MGIGFFILGLLITLAGLLSSMFEQAERRADAERVQRRKDRGSN